MNRMLPSGRSPGRAAKGLILMAIVLFVGIALLAAGQSLGNRLVFSAGLCVTLPGVVAGIQQVAVNGDFWRNGQ